MLSESRLSHLCRLLERITADEIRADYRDVESAIRSTIIEQLEPNQLLYTVDAKGLKVDITKFLGFFHWKDGGIQRTTAIIGSMDRSTNIGTDDYLIRNLMKHSDPAYHVYLDIESATRALRQHKRKMLDQLSKDLETKPSEVK